MRTFGTGFSALTGQKSRLIRPEKSWSNAGPKGFADPTRGVNNDFPTAKYVSPGPPVILSEIPFVSLPTAIIGIEAVDTVDRRLKLCYSKGLQCAGRP
jgi:hypothetical protein